MLLMKAVSSSAKKVAIYMSNYNLYFQGKSAKGKELVSTNKKKPLHPNSRKAAVLSKQITRCVIDYHQIYLILIYFMESGVG